VARHRLVYDAVQDLIDQGIHALAIDWLPHTDPANPD
jgi:stress-induced morphogen